jgi:hypothetical protein
MTGRIAKGIVVAVSWLLAVAAFAGTPGSGSNDVSEEWKFRVYLDDAEIGYHNFRLVDEDGRQQVMTEAEFAVKFLFITAYRYEHTNEETWQGDCLQEISSRTDANGKQFVVNGVKSGDRFAVSANEEQQVVAGCVKTFAYWNPGILDETALMNSQTGEVLPVTVTPLEKETLIVRGEETPARRYKLTARNMEVEIWYSSDDRWLALESTVKGGRKLRYELT